MVQSPQPQGLRPSYKRHIGNAGGRKGRQGGAAAAWGPHAELATRTLRHGGGTLQLSIPVAQSLGPWEELGSSRPDVWQDCGIPHDASQEAGDLEFRREGGREARGQASDVGLHGQMGRSCFLSRAGGVRNGLEGRRGQPCGSGAQTCRSPGR